MAIRLPHCGDCGAAIFTNDDANVCIECGGRNIRAINSRAMCVRCGAGIGWLGRVLERMVGDTHDCPVLRARERRRLIAGLLCTSHRRPLARDTEPAADTTPPQKAAP